MIKNELFTVLEGDRVPTPAEADSDLEDGIFADEEDVPYIVAGKVPGRFIEKTMKIHLPFATEIRVGSLLLREKNGALYAVVSVRQSSLIGRDTVVSVAE